MQSQSDLMLCEELLFGIVLLFAFWPVPKAGRPCGRMLLPGGIRLASWMKKETRARSQRRAALRGLCMKNDVDGELAAFEAGRFSEALALVLLLTALALVFGKVILFFLSVPGAVMWLAEKDELLKKKQKKRQTELRLDYAMMVSRISLFTGAGMTTRAAWESITGEYQKNREEGSPGKKAVYEEMLRTRFRMEQGLPEDAAYEEFGRRCGGMNYLKLGSLLSMNVRQGSRELEKRLEEERRDAFQSRLQLAREQGEEASTRLIFPLIMMLVAVLAIVLTPAYMTLV